MEYRTLSNGVRMPVAGLGVFQFTPAEAERAVGIALEEGVRLIDTANRYMNERAVGRGIRASGVPREQIFLVSKIAPDVFTDESAVDRTLDRLDTEYLDLLFLHHPAGDWRTGYRMVEKAYEDGRVRAIGISNFPEVWLREIEAFMRIPPHAAQEEAHPYFTQQAYRKALDPRNIALMAFYPLGHGDPKLRAEPVFARLAEKYGKTPVQIILRWHIQKGHIVIPGSRSEAHIRENFRIFDFRLTEEEMAEIALLDTETPFHNKTLEMEQEFIFARKNYDDQI